MKSSAKYLFDEDFATGAKPTMTVVEAERRRVDAEACLLYTSSSQPAFSFGRPHRENRILFAAPWIRPRFINRTLTINWANLAG